MQYFQGSHVIVPNICGKNNVNIDDVTTVT